MLTQGAECVNDSFDGCGVRTATTAALLPEQAPLHQSGPAGGEGYRRQGRGSPWSSLRLCIPGTEGAPPSTAPPLLQTFRLKHNTLDSSCIMKIGVYFSLTVHIMR